VIVPRGVQREPLRIAPAPPLTRLTPPPKSSAAAAAAAGAPRLPPPRLRVLLDRLDAEGETVVVAPPPPPPPPPRGGVLSRWVTWRSWSSAAAAAAAAAPWSSVPPFWVGAFVGPVVLALAVSAAISPRLPQP